MERLSFRLRLPAQLVDATHSKRLIGLCFPQENPSAVSLCIRLIKGSVLVDTRHLPCHFSSVTSYGRLARYTGSKITAPVLG